MKVPASPKDDFDARKAGRLWCEPMTHDLWPIDQIEALANRLNGHARVLIWGEMGVGKSTLALELARWFGRHPGGGQILALDPGSPAFGVPGALSRGRWVDDTLQWADIQALCTLDAARFRLPLMVAASRLCALAEQATRDAIILIDPPGVARGVGAAELLMALVTQLAVDAVITIGRGGVSLPLVPELAWRSAALLRVSAPPQARRPPKAERATHRTSLWDAYLAHGVQETFRLEDIALLGTPPPMHLPNAWSGRQAALIDAQGRTLKMGEVTGIGQGALTLRLPADRLPAPAGILIRDAGRSIRGCLETVARATPLPPAQRIPAEMDPRVIAPGADSAPVFSRVGRAMVTLVGGVFGDPLLHVRLRNQKQSFLFDLGDPARLAARVAHQVRAVFLSHAHLDHIGGFVWFLRSRIGSFGPCAIFGPPETIARIEHFLGAITWDRIAENAPVFDVCEFDGSRLQCARLQPGRPRVALPEVPVKDGLLLEEDNLSIRAAVCDHNIPILAYALAFRMEICVRKERLAASGLRPGPWLGRLKQCIAAQTPHADIQLPDGTRRRAGELAGELTLIQPGKKLVYAADMADTPLNRQKVIDLARGAHTFFCETAFIAADRERAVNTQHLTTLAAVAIARRAGVTRLVPFHFSKRYEHDPGAVYAEILAAAGPVEVVGHFHYRL
jgi:ribonuclease Z